MTIEELLKIPNMESITDEELTIHLAEHFPTTRPKESKIKVDDIFIGGDIMALARERLKQGREKQEIDLSDIMP